MSRTQIHDLELHQRALRVVDVCASVWCITRDEAMGDSREHPAPRARALTYLLCREVGLTWPELGWLMGRDHTTCLVQARAYRRRATEGTVEQQYLLRARMLLGMSERGTTTLSALVEWALDEGRAEGIITRDGRRLAVTIEEAA